MADTKDEAQIAEGQFDPSKIDMTDSDNLSGLSESQLQEVEKYQAAHPAAPALPTQTEKDEKEVPVAPTEAEATPAGDTNVEGTPAPVQADPAPEKKYAGKYKTTDDLIKGVSEAAKVLGLDSEVFGPMIESAKAAQKYEAVEETYKRLDAQIGKKASQTVPAPEQAAQAATAEGVTGADDAKVVEAATAAALNHVVGGEVGREIAAKGFVVPRTTAEFEQLTIDSPYHAMLFRTTFNEAFTRNIAYGREYAKASSEVTGHNTQALDSGVSQVKEFAVKYGLSFSDDDAKALRDAVAADVSSYEDRYGVKFLRADAVLSHFNNKRLPTSIESLLQAAKVTWATEAMKKLEEAQKKSIRTVSTTSLSPSTIVKGVQKKIDLNDTDQLEQLTDEQLEMIGR